MKKIGLGLIGSGFIAGPHCEAIMKNDKIKLVATCAKREKRAREVATKYGAEAYYTDYRDILKRDDIDAVDILLPHNLHCEVSVAAAEAGKHILVEKPMANTVNECDKMIVAAEKGKVWLMVAHNKRFDPFSIAIKKLIDESYLGTITLAEGHYVGSERYAQKFIPSEWRLKQVSSGGGAFMDLGSHYIDLLLWLIPGNVTSVSANTSLLTEGDIMESEDNCVALMQFDTGTIATAEASLSINIPQGFEEGIRLWGSSGIVRMTFLGWEGEPEKTEKFEPIELFAKKGSPPWFHTLPKKFDALISFEKELDHFTTCIIDDKKPIISGEVGRKTIQIIEAAYKSAETEKIIHL